MNADVLSGCTFAGRANTEERGHGHVCHCACDINFHHACPPDIEDHIILVLINQHMKSHDLL